jgi:hypothetical protein
MIFFKKFQDFILVNLLMKCFHFVAVQMLYKNKIIVAKLKNQNGGLLCEK